MAITRTRIADDLRSLGVRRGDLLMIHSSLRSLGAVDGGAPTVVDALLEVLGTEGTLVGPAFTFASASSPDFVFDPGATPSEMGAVAEEIRCRPGAMRSTHALHSLSAVGPYADTIIRSGDASAWDRASPLAKVFDLDGRFLLLGVTYQSFTAVHVLEIEFGTQYRTPSSLVRRLRCSDGSETKLVSTMYPRVHDYPGYDFNRLGQAMEDEGIVSVGGVGNAMARLVPGLQMQEFAAAQIAIDPDYLYRQGMNVLSLTSGFTLDMPRGAISVVDPTRVYNPP